MKRRGLIQGKKGSEDVVYPVFIFIILNLIYFSILILFVHNSSTGASISEEFYAKQIALLINGAETSKNISMDFSKGYEFAEDNELRIEDSVRINENEVIVRLSHTGGYGFKHFSDLNIDVKFEEKNLVLIINEKEN